MNWLRNVTTTSYIPYGKIDSCCQPCCWIAFHVSNWIHQICHHHCLCLPLYLPLEKPHQLRLYSMYTSAITLQILTSYKTRNADIAMQSEHEIFDAIGCAGTKHHCNCIRCAFYDYVNNFTTALYFDDQFYHESDFAAAWICANWTRA